MGEVWLCEHEMLARRAAVKVVRPDSLGAADESVAAELLARFTREAQATSVLESPHTIRVYDFGIADEGTFFYVMELLEGCSMQTLIQRTGPLCQERVIWLVNQACESLAEAHHHGLVHRDIKPGNLHVCRHAMRHDVTKVLDFGLVKYLPDAGERPDELTRDNVPRGTPAYMPPEMVKSSASLGPAADIYALGCVAYYLLTGQLVFEGDNALQMMLAHATKAPTPPSALCEDEISPDLEAVVLQCLAKHPAARPESARALSKMLTSCTPAGNWDETRAATWWQRHRPETWGGPTKTKRGRVSDLDVPAPATNKPSIVVMPFEDRSGAPSPFCDGMAEDIMTDLSKVSGLLVIARNSAFSYRGSQASVPQICRELGVRYALTGGVRQAGSRVRVSAQLIDGRSDTQVWADRFDRDLTDVFAVQDELTERIVGALAVRLTDGERAQIGRRGTTNLDAYDAYLRARKAHEAWTKEAMAESADQCRQAVEIDPQFSAAYATWAICEITDFINGWSEDPMATIASARNHAARAVTIDDREPLAHLARGIVHTFDKEHDSAIAKARLVMELEPNLASAFMLLGNALHYAGRNTESVEAYRKVLRLDPVFPVASLFFLAQSYFGLERFTDAIELLERRIALNPSTDSARVLLAAAHGHLGEPEAAQAAWDAAIEFNPKYSLQQRRSVLPYADPREFDRVIEGLAKVGIEQR